MIYLVAVLLTNLQQQVFAGFLISSLGLGQGQWNLHVSSIKIKYFLKFYFLEAVTSTEDKASPLYASQ